MKIAELKELLTETYNLNEKDLRGKSRDELTQMLEEARSADLDFNTKTDEPKSEYEDCPTPADAEWTDFVLGQLRDNEKVDKHPKVDGLRRLVEELLGPIISSKTIKVEEFADGALVVHEIEIDNRYTGIETFSRSADVTTRNTNASFAIYPVAVAETRALGRALRAALRLVGVVSAEEIGDKNQISFDHYADTINDVQITAMEKMCKRLDINAAAFIKNFLGKEKVILNKIKYEQAQDMQERLSDHQRGAVEIPANIKGFNNNWKGEL